ncbi:MAG: FecR domain-containing protein, partial [Gammaproteobacteria bacterium]|nr:FecR domain-containing protein [Gammaproteobacteria bacterium]
MPETPTTGNTASDAAIRWFARLRAPDLRPAEREAFRSWLEAAPEHGEAYRSVEAMWRDLGALEAPGAAPAARSGAATGARRDRRGRRSAALAAGLAVAVLAGGWLLPGLMDDPTRLHTDRGAQEVVRLADATVVHLNTATDLRLDYTPARRRLILERGEIFLEVGRDPRPLVVEAAGGRIRDIGTRFGVRIGAGGTTVTVTEGAVAVRLAGAEASAGAGERLDYSADGGLGTPRPAALERATAWLRGLLLFEATPLAEVVEELNRYRAAPVRLGDPALAGLRVSGRFSIGDSDGLLRTLEAVQPLTVVQRADGS